MRSSTGADYKNVHGLMRGLAVLHALNRAHEGTATPGELSKQTGLHRTTVRRLLETLMSDGYVRRSDSDDSYRLCLKVRDLSEGFSDDEWISQIASPMLGALLKQVVWPSDLTTPNGDAMVIRETTHRFSPLSFHRSMVGRQMPMLFSASGRAYFAFCGERERGELLRLMIESDDENTELARNSTLVQRMVAKTQADGYGTNYGEWKREEHVAAIAVPIRHQGQVLACLNVVCLKRAVTLDALIERYLPALRGTVADIERQLTSKSAGLAMRSPL